MANIIKFIYTVILFVSLILVVTYGDPSCTHDYDCPFIECPTHHMKCIYEWSNKQESFEVDGEPNFDFGPSEDEWEYLRHVRLLTCLHHTKREERSGCLVVPV
ncbi:hypothetical protein P8452_52679 [Trifolium repens]|nr:hypothetical protein P8452_52679 [Trifolium repens]